MFVATFITDTSFDTLFGIYANVSTCPSVDTVIVADNGVLLVFIAVNDEISPVPEAGSPIEGVLFTQL